MENLRAASRGLASLKRQRGPEVSMSKRDLFEAMSSGQNKKALADLRGRLANNRRFTSSTSRLNTYAEQELEERGEDMDGDDAAARRLFDPSSLASLSLTQWKDGLAQWFLQLRSWQLSELLLDLREQRGGGTDVLRAHGGRLLRLLPLLHRLPLPSRLVGPPAGGRRGRLLRQHPQGAGPASRARRAGTSCARTPGCGRASSATSSSTSSRRRRWTRRTARC